jgi:hypothetical protein
MTPIWAPFGTAYTFRAPVIKAASTDFAATADWTPATGDVKVIQNGTLLGNVTTLPTFVSGQVTMNWALSAAEMATDEVIIQVVDAATKTIQDQMFRIITLPQGAVRSRLAQAGASTTITLDTGATSTDNIFNGNIVAIIAGTGAGQNRVITAYAGATRVAAVDSAWIINPDATSVFALYPQGILGLSVAQVTAAVPSVSQISAQVFDTEVVETGMTFRQSMRLASAVLFGRRSGTNSGTEVFNAAVTNAKARVTGTIDSSGNRTNVTTDGT